MQRLPRSSVNSRREAKALIVDFRFLFSDDSGMEVSTAQYLCYSG